MTSLYPAQAAWLEVSRQALRDNVTSLRLSLLATASSTQFGVVLKGNAYGHGLLAVCEAVHDVVDCIFLINPLDAILIREFERRHAKPERRLIVIGAVATAEVIACAEQNIEVALTDASWSQIVAALKNAKRTQKIKVHLHVDTGLAREGFPPQSFVDDLSFLNDAADVLNVVGLFSHFANTEDVTEQNYAEFQLAQFATAEALFRQHFSFLLLPNQKLERHFAASAAAMVLPTSRFDTLRVGISLYGLWPSTETRLSAKIVLPSLPTLKPALRWRCISQLTKIIPAGSFVGYGCTYRCESETRIAIFPIGYFDGYPRLVSGKAHVLVKGTRCPVIGRVMMNHIIVDISRVKSEPHEQEVTATLLGFDDHNTAISAEQLADWSQTIHYEIVTRIGPHLQRRLV